MLWWLAQNAVLAGLLAVAVAALCRIGRFRPAVRHALWLVVLLKLVTPPVFAWPGVTLKVEPEAEPQRSSPPTEEPAQTYEILAPVPLDAIISFVPTDDPAPAVQPNPPAPTPAAPGSPRPAPAAWQWPEWLAPVAVRIFWFGAAGMALLQLVRVNRFRRLLERGRPAPAALLAEIDQYAARLGVRPPEVCVLPGLASPLVCGLGRPRLLWPEGLSDTLPSECQSSVIVHELAHLRRRDHWVAWLRTLAGCLWWWNPLYWYVSRQLGRNAELACDAWVIGALPHARRAYAEALVAVAGWMSKTAVPAPAVGMRGSRRDFERRLVMIMRESVPCKTPVLGLVAIGVLALAVLPSLSLSQQANKPAKIAQPQQPAQPANPAPAQSNGPFEVDVVLDPQEFVLYTNQIASAPADERDRKIEDLENKLKALLKEVQALRGTKTPGSVTTKPKANEKPAAVQFQWAQPHVVTDGQWRSEYKLEPSKPGEPYVYSVTRGADGQTTVTLTRATYKLSKEKADALAAFLKHVKASVLESKVEDDGIVVTTTPEVQHTIGQLVALMEGKTYRASLHLAPANVTAPARVLSEPKQP